MSGLSSGPEVASALQPPSTAIDDDSDIHILELSEPFSSGNSMVGNMLPDDGNDHRSDEREMSTNGDSPNKRAKRETCAMPDKQAAPPVKRRRKNLSLLPDMHLDVLFEILGLLTPKDLLNVSRTNKLFYNTLWSRGARTVWKYSLESAEAPACPSDVAEPRWARLLFRTSCESCGTKNIQKADFYLRRRVCAGCKKKHLIREQNAAQIFPKCDQLQLILSLIPNTNATAWGHSSNSRYFWLSDIWDMIHTIAVLPNDESQLAAFIQQRKDLVNGIRSAASELGSWERLAAWDRQEEIERVRESRLNAIHAKFLELGYEKCDIRCIDWDKECTQKTPLTDLIWKRIRPILEPKVQKRRDGRIAFKKRDTMHTRQNILAELYIDYIYKESISPPHWKYLPAILEISEQEPFKSVIQDTALDIELTEADFKPFMPMLPEVITAIQDGLKAKLVQLLTDASAPGKILPSNCLELATSVFCCRGRACESKIYVVGTDNILSHNCDRDTVVSSRYIWEHTARDFVIDPSAVAVVTSLVLCVGLDPETALASEMDANKDLRFACNEPSCVDGRAFGYSWRDALSHGAKFHKSLQSSGANIWRVLTPVESSFLKQNEAADEKWREDRWSCSYCPISLHRNGLSLDTVIQHIRSAHNIAFPTAPVDFFYFEKIVTPFQEPNKRYVDPEMCSNCWLGSPFFQNPLFDTHGVISHLKAAHLVENPIEGVHWFRNSRDAGP